MPEIYWIVLGDIHGDISGIKEIQEIEGASGILVSGDLTNHGGRADVSRILSPLRASGVPVWAQIGNMDTAEAQAYLESEGVSMHRRILEIAPGVGLFGVGYSTPTPFNTPSEVPERVLREWLFERIDDLREYDHLLFVVHTPPSDTKTDALGSGAHVGSPAVREFIELTQPEVCVTGHIHEARAIDRLGSTRLINPGTFAAGGYVVVRYVSGRLEAELKTISA